MEGKKIYLANGDVLIRTPKGDYFRVYSGTNTPLHLKREEGELLALETADMLSTALKAVTETSFMNAKVAEKFEDALREIETHIRSTPSPVPHIVNTLKKALEEYED